jgi:hypothetical protein
MGKKIAGYPNVRFINWTYVYRVQDKHNIGSVIIPTFNIYPLLTSKYYYFNLFQLAFYERNPFMIHSIKEQFSHLPQLYKAEHSVLPTKSWIIGFIEAEGSFHISCDKGYYYHEFSINQTLDTFLLDHIKVELGITSKITSERAPASTQKTHKLCTSKRLTIDSIIRYFDGWLVGVKAFEFTVWANSFKSSQQEKQSAQLYLRFLRDRHKVMHYIHHVKGNKDNIK